MIPFCFGGFPFPVEVIAFIHEHMNACIDSPFGVVIGAASGEKYSNLPLARTRLFKVRRAYTPVELDESASEQRYRCSMRAKLARDQNQAL
jgi:hypothetical protein